MASSPAKVNLKNPLETVLAALEKLSLSVKSSGDEFKAQCPAHDDGTASLSVKAGKNGTVLLKCFAGCETAAVDSALWHKLFTGFCVSCVDFWVFVRVKFRPYICF